MFSTEVYKIINKWKRESQNLIRKMKSKIFGDGKYSEMTMKTPLWILELKERLRGIKNPNSRYLEWI